jgi:uncharacterized repeat protein (TIGR03803 family)
MVREWTANIRRVCLKIPDPGSGPGSTTPKVALKRATLLLALLSTLLLVANRPAKAQNETVLYTFGAPVSTGNGLTGPVSSLVFDRAGNLYGTTVGDDRLGYGTVFELSRNGSGGWNETVLHTFTGGADGAYPASSLIFDSVGNLYGTASGGGAHGYGVVFKLSRVGSRWTETVLHSFAGAPDGATPTAGVTMGAAGNLYGSTPNGGTGDGTGTVFELSPSSGGWTEQVIYNLDINVQSCGYFVATSGLTMDAAGDLFGAACSIVFELSPNGVGTWIPTVLHTFTGFPEDGNAANGTPVLDSAGNLYGTTYYGGENYQGTVYKLSLGKEGWQEEILHAFGAGRDCDNPWAGVVLDAAGNIYGTAAFGGAFSGPGCVFELTLVNGEGYKENILWSFNNADGATPLGSLIMDRASNLYGTTSAGGLIGGAYDNNGVVFEVNLATAPDATTLSSSLNPSIFGQSVTWTASVKGARSIAPTGTVSFSWDGYSIGTATLNSSGVATLTKSNLSAYTYPLTAAYLGDANNAASTSAILNQVVRETTSAAKLTSSPNPSTKGQAVTFTATITSPTVVPTGRVTFTSGTTVLGTVQLSGGKATFKTSALAVGSTAVKATYSGDSNISESSASVTQTVQP